MTTTLGLDVGGAHLKAAWLSGGELIDVAQEPCPLWQGLDRLEAALATVAGRHRPVAVAAVTMTGELVDLFADRADGVGQILDALASALPGVRLEIFAGPTGFLPPGEARRRVAEVASANWHATAALAALALPEGILVDIGSTTTDIVPFANGRVLHAGYTDATRMETGELLYTGVVRTPVMAVASQAPVDGVWRGVMAEYFATMADAHRLAGTLPEGADLHPTADGRDKGPEASARRLARMVGADLGEGDHAAGGAVWRRLADHFIDRQIRKVEDGLAQVVSRGVVPDEAPVVGAGVGRFLVERVAARTGRPYRFLMEAATLPDCWRSIAADCAPAVAVALLCALGRSPDGARRGRVAWASG
ncbi:S-layer protein [Azospirillum sp. YIM B02556]|uniref:S-layer protein n=1 Tax=Azospirillum endophyticum TaxID=2800326 RepID=A0ABS1F0C0_9PROT|nr:hydantoinase/oxoprolinase family protein [Azospirillum endophyticum]MBK1836809.1 S-layer protein [Azospirillum endophyticum]